MVLSFLLLQTIDFYFKNVCAGHKNVSVIMLMTNRDFVVKNLSLI